MPEALVPKDEMLERCVAMFRAKLQSALDNGQRVRMTVRDGASTPTVPMRVFQHQSLAQLLTKTEPDGSFELHVYIEPKR
jgi:hypothetical protein